MNIKFIQKGEIFLAFHPNLISDQIASQNLIQVQDRRGNVLYDTMELPDTEENRREIYAKYIIS